MAGVGSLAGPALGALGRVPAPLGGMLPFRGGLGGGVPLGDLGAGIGSAIRDAGAHGDPAAPSTGRCHPEAEDAELRAALDETLAMAEQFIPTVILLTAGVALAHSSVSFGGPPPTK
jgi:hypothetical protein